MAHSTFRFISATILILSVITIFSSCYSSEPSPEIQELHSRIADLEYELEIEYERGLDHGYENGLIDGKAAGYDEGFYEGYEAGFIDGAEAGYADGYADCEAGY